MDLSTAYENAAFIPGAEEFPPRWAAEAEAFRKSLGPRARPGLPYGADEREAFDLFLPEESPRGLVIFIHGGYWRAFGRESWSHLAAGPLGRGWAVAVPSYTLAPAARIAGITRQMAAAFDAAAAEVAGPVVVTGHSAGGHLAARLACTDVALGDAGRLARIVPISPLSDLGPLMQTKLNDDLRIDPAEADAESPISHTMRAGVTGHVWVGEDERPAFLDQARWLSEAWGLPLTFDRGRHHFDVIDGLTRADSPLTAALFEGL
ncbi:alpha/beta hydrolase [Rhodobacteraceae bacterium WD3A24]|nr:alpha/beta hydrolase [Rhodobacteraceae bacterium WD3A24]